MKDAYTKEVEKQNEALRDAIEDTTSKLMKLEKEIYLFDYRPTFVINHRKKSPLPTYDHYPFIHQNIDSALEVVVDYVADAILTHVERVDGKKRRSPKTICMIDFQCWYLGSLERTYIVHIVYPMQKKYSISIGMDKPPGILPMWDEEFDNYYKTMIPTEKSLHKYIVEEILDCKDLHQYLYDK